MRQCPQCYRVYGHTEVQIGVCSNCREKNRLEAERQKQLDDQLIRQPETAQRDREDLEDRASVRRGHNPTNMIRRALEL